MVRIWVSLAAGALLLAGLASPADASFPGGDGLLAVEPLTGPGIELVSPSGSVVRTVCTEAAICGAPATPRFSSDGRAIAFVDRSTGRVAIVAPDGVCLWCLVGPSPTGIRGHAPAFTARRGQLTLVGGRAGAGRLWRVDLAANASSRVSGGSLSDAVWSSTGELAITRSGHIWVRGRGPHTRLQRLAAGASPAWSPDGKRLAIVRGGWIRIVRVRSGAQRRLVRGGSPTWAPDGRSIAYLGQDHRLRVIPTAGGRVKSLGIVARSVDWQPLTNRRGCTLPAGSQVLASSPDALLATVTTTSYDIPFLGWAGCVRALGKLQKLGQAQTAQGYGYNTDIVVAEQAGRFALLATSYNDKYHNCSQNAWLYDMASAASVPLYGLGCGGPGGPTVGSQVLSSVGFAAWRTTDQVPRSQQLSALACPSAALCLAGDATGAIATSQNPTGGRSQWSISNPDNKPQLGSISCPTTQLCIGATLNSNTITVYFSTNPADGKAATWTRVPVTSSSIPIFTGSYVSCPSASLCVLAGADGSVFSSTDPTGGSSSWTGGQVLHGTPPSFLGLSCPTASLCVGLDAYGDVVTSTDPTGGPSTWTLTRVESSGTYPPIGGPAPATVSCPSSSFCAVAGTGGNVLTSTDPTGGSGAWTSTHLSAPGGGAFGIWSIKCLSASFCIATDQSGDVATSSDPGGGASAWQVTKVDGSIGVNDVSCPSVSLCIAVDGAGNVLSSANPLGGSGAWNVSAVDVPDCVVQGTSCVEEKLFVRDDHGLRVLDSAPPGTGKEIGNVQFGPDPLVLSWTHSGAPEQATLG